jgi:hypothetical protein
MGIDAAEKERKMAHYYYHCELNPQGFEKLRYENFKKDGIRNIQEEYKGIK